MNDICVEKVYQADDFSLNDSPWFHLRNLTNQTKLYQSNYCSASTQYKEVKTGSEFRKKFFVELLSLFLGGLRCCVTSRQRQEIFALKEQDHGTLKNKK